MKLFAFIFSTALLISFYSCTKEKTPILVEVPPMSKYDSLEGIYSGEMFVSNHDWQAPNGVDNPVHYYDEYYVDKEMKVTVKQDSVIYIEDQGPYPDYNREIILDENLYYIGPPIGNPDGGNYIVNFRGEENDSLIIEITAWAGGASYGLNNLRLLSLKRE